MQYSNVYAFLEVHNNPALETCNLFFSACRRVNADLLTPTNLRAWLPDGLAFMNL